MKNLLLIICTVCALNATAQTYKPARGPVPHAAPLTQPIHGTIVAVLTNANAVLLQEYEHGNTNKPSVLVMVRNVTNGIVGQHPGYDATNQGFVTYHGYRLPLWDAPIIHPRPIEPTKISGDIVAVLTNAVVVQEYDSHPSAYGANEYGQRIVIGRTKTPTTMVVVQNVHATNSAEGDFVIIPAMRAGVTNYQGHTLQLWAH